MCFETKYGYCKFGQSNDKINLTDICNENEHSRAKYCDEVYPITCWYFEKSGRCKFGRYCSYTNVKV